MKAPVWLALGVTACGLAYDPGSYAASPKRALSVLLGCACIATVLVSAKNAPARRPRRIPRALLAALAFVLLSIVSFSWGRPPGALDAATWIAGTGVAVLSLHMRRLSAVASARLSAQWLGGAAGAICVASALIGAKGFALHAGQGNPNWLGLLLAVTIPLSIDTCIMHMKRGARSARRAVLSVFFLLPQLPALALSHSRVAWVACAAAVLLVLALSAQGWRRGAVQAAAAGVLVLGVFTGSPAGAEEHEAFTNDVPAAQSLHGRVQIWKTSAAAARDAAPFGAGLGSFDRTFHEAQGRALAKLAPGAAARAYENATTAHQEYLQIAAESGPLCALALALALALGVVSSARSRFFGGAGALAACAVSALGDSPLRQPAVVLLLALTLGALRGHRARRPMTGWSRPAVAAAALRGPHGRSRAACARGWARAPIWLPFRWSPKHVSRCSQRACGWILRRERRASSAVCSCSPRAGRRRRSPSCPPRTSA